jgi:hypothetical protein
MDVIGTLQSLAPWLPLVPVVTYLVSIIIGVSWIDRFLNPATRADLANYLKHRDLSDASKRGLQAAKEVITLVFGEKHFTMRCFVPSALFSIASIILFYVTSTTIFFVISRHVNDSTKNVIILY